MNETRPHDDQGSVAGAVGARPRSQEQPLDDWLGEISDEDWSESDTERAGRRHATSASQVPPVPEGDLEHEPIADRRAPGAPIAAAEARRAVIERRRLVAALVFVLVLGLAAAIAVILLRGGGEAPTTPVQEPTTTTTPAAEGTSPSPAPTTPSTTPSTTTPTTTTSTGAAATFTLPEGTKLRLGQGDPAVVKELQQALATAGYNPGPADGTFGPGTEAAVIAFQQDNGLTPDGVVGPETASALNAAVAGG